MKRLGGEMIGEGDEGGEGGVKSSNMSTSLEDWDGDLSRDSFRPLFRERRCLSRPAARFLARRFSSDTIASWSAKSLQREPVLRWELKEIQSCPQYEQWERRRLDWSTLGSPFPWCEEAVFIWIDHQKIWNEYTRNR